MKMKCQAHVLNWIKLLSRRTVRWRYPIGSKFKAAFSGAADWGPGWLGCDDFDGRTDTSACQSCPHHSLITWPWARYSASPGLSCQFQSLSPVFRCSIYQQLWTWLIRPFLKYSFPAGRGHLSLLGPSQPSWPLFLSLLCLIVIFPSHIELPPAQSSALSALSAPSPDVR